MTTAETENRLADIQRILEDPDPQTALFDFVGRHHVANPALAVAAFEAVLENIGVDRYWTLYQIALAYRSIGDAPASFLIAKQAEEMEPEAPSWHLYQVMYHYHIAQGDVESAATVLLRHLEKSPESSIIAAHEIESILAQTGMTISGLQPLELATETSPRLNSTEVVGTSTMILPKPRGFGPPPLALRAIAPNTQRKSVTVSEISDATVIIQDGSILVFDSDGALYPQFSRAEMPLAVYARHRRLVDKMGTFPNARTETAGIITDKFSSRNICHLLLDYMPRLELFRLAGADISKLAIVTEELALPFMRDIAQAFGVQEVIACEQRLVLRADRLFVSDNSKNTFQHPGHLAAPFVVQAVRQAFGATDDDSKHADLRLYVSRKDAGVRRVRNEDEVIRLLQAAGFKTITASDMPFVEQAALFRRASHIVSAHGAALTNIVFAPPGSHVLEFFHPIGNNPTYAIVSAGARLRYATLTGRDAESASPIWNDPELTETERAHAGGSATMNNRDIFVPLDQLTAWVEEFVPPLDV